MLMWIPRADLCVQKWDKHEKKKGCEGVFFIEFSNFAFKSPGSEDTLGMIVYGKNEVASMDEFIQKASKKMR